MTWASRESTTFTRWPVTPVPKTEPVLPRASTPLERHSWWNVRARFVYSSVSAVLSSGAASSSDAAVFKAVRSPAATATLLVQPPEPLASQPLSRSQPAQPDWGRHMSGAQPVHVLDCSRRDECACSLCSIPLPPPPLSATTPLSPPLTDAVAQVRLKATPSSRRECSTAAVCRPLSLTYVEVPMVEVNSEADDGKLPAAS
mmetsp:Transcript_13511/g.40855  ORF Transcript_13511/g.40855 Transcript_13511/m.40855 type:complete len:201 (-) Transcript_13511:328-930(-)